MWRTGVLLDFFFFFFFFFNWWQERHRARNRWAKSPKTTKPGSGPAVIYLPRFTQAPCCVCAYVCKIERERSRLTSTCIHVLCLWLSLTLVFGARVKKKTSNKVQLLFLTMNPFIKHLVIHKSAVFWTWINSALVIHHTNDMFSDKQLEKLLIFTEQRAAWQSFAHFVVD